MIDAGTVTFPLSEDDNVIVAAAAGGELRNTVTICVPPMLTSNAAGLKSVTTDPAETVPSVVC